MSVCLVNESIEATSAAPVAAPPAAGAAAEPDRLFTLTPSRWLELDKECATFLHTTLRYASGDQSKAVVVGNVEQMESAVKNIKVRLCLLQNFRRRSYIPVGTRLPLLPVIARL